MPARLIHLVDLVRTKGIRRIATELFKEYVFEYSRWYVFYRPLTSATTFLPDEKFRYRLATVDDIERLAVFEPYRFRSEFCNWLENDVWLFIALDGARPVAFDSISRFPPPQLPLSRIALAKDQVWTVDAYTCPEYRRRHVATRLREYRHSVLQKWGYRGNVSSVRNDNLPSLAYVRNYGGSHRLIQRVTYLRVLRFGRISVKEDARMALDGRLSRAGVLRRTPGAPTLLARHSPPPRHRSSKI